MPQFFNRNMERYRNINQEDERELKTAFKNAIGIIYSMFGSEVFTFNRFIPGDSLRNTKGNWDKTGKVNGALFDVLMGLFADQNKNVVMSNLDSLRESLIDLMASDPDFNDSITLWTSQPKRVNIRFEKVKQCIDDVLSGTNVQDRCFSLQLKQKLFDANDTCTLCDNKIHVLDDAAVDHIEQYWLGGKTIPENARLTHRYCNMARSRTK
jgi:hypothetical protein